MAVILITGGSGLIGRHIVEALLEQGGRPVLYDLSADASAIRDPKGQVAVEIGDIGDRAHLSRTMRKWEIDYVVHAAAMVSHDAGADPGAIYRVNVDGTDNVFAAALENGVKRVVWASSGAAIGRGADYDGAMVDERYGHRPAGLYGMSKLACEALSKVYRDELGLDNIAFRPPLVFGRGRLTGGAGLFNDMVRRVALGEPATLWMPFASPWQHLYGPDMARLFVAAMLAPRPEAHIFNGPSWTSSANEIVDALKALRPNASIEIRTFDSLLPIPPLLDGSLAERVFDFRPAYPLDRALDDLMAHYRV